MAPRDARGHYRPSPRYGPCDGVRTAAPARVLLWLLHGGPGTTRGNGRSGWGWSRRLRPCSVWPTEPPTIRDATEQLSTEATASPGELGMGRLELDAGVRRSVRHHRAAVPRWRYIRRSPRRCCMAGVSSGSSSTTLEWDGAAWTAAQGAFPTQTLGTRDGVDDQIGRLVSWAATSVRSTSTTSRTGRGHLVQSWSGPVGARSGHAMAYDSTAIASSYWRKQRPSHCASNRSEWASRTIPADGSFVVGNRSAIRAGESRRLMPVASPNRTTRWRIESYAIACSRARAHGS